MAEIYYRKNNPDQLCSSLYEEARKSWVKQNNGRIDDITVLTTFIKI